MCRLLLLVAMLAVPGFAVAADKPAGQPPNVILIFTDDLGYGDLGCYGQKRIKTPHVDRMAQEGVRFTQCYAGSTVCAPSRSALMTGQHTGHTLVRGNARVPLRPEEVTVAKVVKSAGYRTGLIGKWGLGEPDSTGIPNLQGFDYFFGYLNQHLAHNYYPDYLWRNQEKVLYSGNVVEKNVASKRTVYSHDLFTEEALKFVEQEPGKPFFLYLAYTIPHANNEAGKEGMETPSDEPYTKENWPQQQKNHAAMITRMDADVGKLLQKLKDLKLDEKTIVFFTSDNGPHKEGGNDPKFNQSSGALRGIKRDLTEGGIRVPMLARWPGRIPAATVSDQVWAFWDFLPTAAELAVAKSPAGIDGISMVPALLGEKVAGRPQTNHEFLYWEFHEGGFKQAVRMGDWKLIRQPYGKEPAPQLYNLKDDLGETKDLAAERKDIVARIEAYLKTARTESKDWPVPPKKN
ncbi:MAG: arylsulfatase [Planctomycetia bacterium]|nr:arylsulfatase [Planctomycetia bacterium]